jgi:hypothetical protein
VLLTADLKVQIFDLPPASCLLPPASLKEYRRYLIIYNKENIRSMLLPNLSYSREEKLSM